MVQKLLVDVAKSAPEAALSALVNDVLPEPSNWEATMVGLQALLTILFDGLQHSSHAGIQQETQVNLCPHCCKTKDTFSESRV